MELFWYYTVNEFMSFFKMRVINTFLVLVIGLTLGFLLKASPHKYGRVAGKERPTFNSPDAQTIRSGRESTSVSEETPDSGEGRDEPGLEIFTSPFTKEGSGPGNEPDEDGEKPESSEGSSEGTERQDRAESFFKNPERYKNSELELRLEMVNLEKIGGKWRFYMSFTARNKDVGYIDIDADEFPGDSTRLSVGAVYKVRFKCLKGDFISGNSLVSITAAGGRGD